MCADAYGKSTPVYVYIAILDDMGEKAVAFFENTFCFMFGKATHSLYCMYFTGRTFIFLYIYMIPFLTVFFLFLLIVHIYSENQ